jgi:hypothetical protein
VDDESTPPVSDTTSQALLLPPPPAQPNLLPEAQSPNEEAEAKAKRFKRPGKRKAGFRMDTPPWPIRAIWELASTKERQDAYQLAVQILEHWLGRQTRKDLGDKLNLPPLRVWQLSQQALTGMVVALMAQPKRPPQGTPLPMAKLPDVEELKELRKEVRKLRDEKKVLEDLLVLLREMPGQGDTPAPKGKKTTARYQANPMAGQGRGLAAEQQTA